MKEPVLTKKDVANRLGVSTRTVQRLNLPHTRVGGQNRYFWSEVAAFLGIDVPEIPETSQSQPQIRLTDGLRDLEARLAAVEAELSSFRVELREFIKKTMKEEHD